MNITGYEITVTFDSTALSYVISERGTYLPEGAVDIFVPEATDNSVKLSGFAADPSGALTADGDAHLLQ